MEEHYRGLRAPRRTLLDRLSQSTQMNSDPVHNRAHDNPRALVYRITEEPANVPLSIPSDIPPYSFEPRDNPVFLVPPTEEPTGVLTSRSVGYSLFPSLSENQINVAGVPRCFLSARSGVEPHLHGIGESPASSPSALNPREHRIEVLNQYLRPWNEEDADRHRLEPGQLVWLRHLEDFGGAQLAYEYERDTPFLILRRIRDHFRLLNNRGRLYPDLVHRSCLVPVISYWQSISLPETLVNYEPFDEYAMDDNEQHMETGGNVF
jgi:hypothetical protein